jgi:hypothetical protein
MAVRSQAESEAAAVPPRADLLDEADRAALIRRLASAKAVQRSFISIIEGAPP